MTGQFDTQVRDIRWWSGPVSRTDRPLSRFERILGQATNQPKESTPLNTTLDEVVAALTSGASIEVLDTYKAEKHFFRVAVRPRNSSRTFTAIVRIVSAEEV